MSSVADSKGNRSLIGLILILIIICSLTAGFALNIQNNLSSLQSNYYRLSNENQNLQNRLNSLQSSLNNIENDILLNSSQERIQIVFVSAIDENTVTVRAKSLTGVDIVVVDAVVRDSSDQAFAQNNNQMTPTILSAMGGYKTFDINFQNANFALGTAYSITLITEKGNSFTYPSFTRHIDTPTPTPHPSIP